MKRLVGVVTVIAIALSLFACGGGGDTNDSLGSTVVNSDTNDSLGSTVVNSDGNAVVGATVYLIPTDKIDVTPIKGDDIITSPFPAEAYDEPLEDAVRADLALPTPTFAKAVTNSSGGFSLSAPDATMNYFVYVEPEVTDLEHLPGGSLCRESLPASSLSGLRIEMASQPSTADYFLLSIDN